MTQSDLASLRMYAAENASVGSDNMRIIDVINGMAQKATAFSHVALLFDSLGDGYPVGFITSKGDVFNVAIWEAPPAAMFGASGGDPMLTSSRSTARRTSKPEQMVDSAGRFMLAFTASIQAAGRVPKHIECDIMARLVGKAYLPQAIVRLIRNSASKVTVMGNVANSARVPRTATRERLLDTIANDAKFPESHLFRVDSRSYSDHHPPLIAAVSGNLFSRKC